MKIHGMSYKLVIVISIIGILANGYILFWDVLPEDGMESLPLVLIFGFFGFILPYFVLIQRAHPEYTESGVVLFWTLLGTAISVYVCWEYAQTSDPSKIMILPFAWIPLWIATMFSPRIKIKDDI